MIERLFQINFERQLNAVLPGYNILYKLNSDTIFHYINRAKDEYIKLLYRVFQLNQEITDKLRTLVCTTTLSSKDFKQEDNRWSCDYPTDYLFGLGEEVSIEIIDNKCPNLVTKTRDILEATIESVDRILENSLSEYHLHHNQARPVRLFTDNKIYLITDGKYNIKDYKLTYLRHAYDLGSNLEKEYEDLPQHTHQEIIDAAVALYVLSVASTRSSNKEE